MVSNGDKSQHRSLRQALTSCGVAVSFLLSIGAFGGLNGIWDRPFGFWATVYYAKAGIEVIASCFAIFYILVALNHRRPASAVPPRSPRPHYPNVAMAYLCCDDLDRRALENVVMTCARYKTRLWIHDDSTADESRSEVDGMTRVMQDKYSLSIVVLRRADRVGGKPGALNNVVQNLPPEVEFLLLCDSDSFLPDTRFLGIAVGYFDDPQVALVQCRNVGSVFPEDGTGYRILSISIDFYDTFVAFMDRFGWSPFLGHNALLRVSTIRQLGGFTPGQLADDIDYSAKLRLSGYRIRYAREIACGERHPQTYEALRRRTRKWAHGCTQILLRWGWPVLTSARISIRDKLTFFLTVGYYHFQVLLLAYLVIVYVMLPFSDPYADVANLMVAAGLILFFTFVPSIAYFAQNHNLLLWPKIATYWGLTYGSQEFVMLGAVVRCFFRASLKWTPTNGVSDRLRTINYVPELLFGLLIVVVAALKYPILLLLPTTMLFAGKFLVSPLLSSMVFGQRSRDLRLGRLRRTR